MTIITIDLDKFFKLNKKSELCDLEANLMESKVKKKSCNRCILTFEELSKTCRNCLIRPTLVDNFQQNKKELDKVFKGAPLMFNTRIASEKPVWKSRIYNHIVRYNIEKGCIYRLPSTKEAPRNIWLAPWIEMPIALMELTVLLWAKNGQVKQYNKGRCEPNNIAWENVIKVMILED